MYPLKATCQEPRPEEGAGQVSLLQFEGATSC